MRSGGPPASMAEHGDWAAWEYDDGRLVIYDIENPEAWVQADTTVADIEGL